MSRTAPQRCVNQSSLHEQQRKNKRHLKSYLWSFCCLRSGRETLFLHCRRHYRFANNWHHFLYDNWQWKGTFISTQCLDSVLWTQNICSSIRLRSSTSGANKKWYSMQKIKSPWKLVSHKFYACRPFDWPKIVAQKISLDIFNKRNTKHKWPNYSGFFGFVEFHINPYTICRCTHSGTYLLS